MSRLNLAFDSENGRNFSGAAFTGHKRFGPSDYRRKLLGNIQQVVEQEARVFVVVL